MNRRLVESSEGMIYVCIDCGNALGFPENTHDNCDVCDGRRAGEIVLAALSRLDNDHLILAFRAIGLTDLEKMEVVLAYGITI